MSYEGYETYLCEKGHKWVRGAGLYHEEPLKKCPFCPGKPKWVCSTDETNGFYEDEPATHPARMKEVAFEDFWSFDHYGNRYAVKIVLHEPVQDGRWRKLT